MTLPDKDELITERVCELKRRDVKEMARNIKEFREDFNTFKINDFHHLTGSVLEMNKQIGELCNEIGKHSTWQKDHENLHNSSSNMLALVAKYGGWVVSFIGMMILSLHQLGLFNTK